MKLFYKRILAIGLSTVFIASLAACSSGKTTSTNETSTQTEATETTTGAETGAETDTAVATNDDLGLTPEEASSLAWSKYDEPITLTRAQMTCTCSQWENGDTATNNPWIRGAKDYFNIDLQDAWAADGSQFSDKVNLSIASQDLPDAMWVNANQLATVAKAGMVQDMTEAYNNYASDLTKQLMAADPASFDSGKFDGKLLGVSSQNFGFISDFSYVWIRDDWMKNLNLSAPKNMDDLINICEQFTIGDPDKNGKDDTYGMTANKNLSSLYTLMGSYHANPTIWLTDDAGQMMYGAIQPNVKTALAAYQEMYKKGILSSEFAVMDGDKVTQDLVSGKVGVAISSSSFNLNPGADIIKANGVEAVFKPYELPSVDSDLVMQSMGWGVGNYLVVSKSCKNPEAAIKMVNLYTKLANEGTPEQTSSYINNERSWSAMPFTVFNPMADYDQYVAISDVQDSRDTSNLKADQLMKYEKVIDWIDNKTPDSVGYYYQVSKEGAYSIAKPLVDNKQYIQTAFRGRSTPTQVQKQSSLDTLQAEMFTKIIMGEPIDNFDEFVTKWNTLGGEQITLELNEQAKEYK